MAKTVFGIGASHTTLMNTQWHKVDHLPQAHQFRSALSTASGRLHAAQPDVAIVVGSNHFRGHWLDLMPAFAIAVDEIHASGEHGTPFGAQSSNPKLALSLANHLVAAGFDLAFSTRLVIDHGISHAIQYLTLEGAIPVIPIAINCFAPPLPSLARCIALGHELARAIASWPAELRVAVIASGGLSHQLPFPDWRHPESENDRFLVESWRNGRNDWQRYEARRREIIVNATPRLNEEFDLRFLTALTTGDTEAWLTSVSETSLTQEAGNGANELRSWLTMHAATGFLPGKLLTYVPMPEWLTGMGVFCCEPNIGGIVE